MIFLKPPSEQSFKILLIASEIIIPVIVFVGMYYIFKPVFGKKPEEDVVKENQQDVTGGHTDPGNPDQ